MPRAVSFDFWNTLAVFNPEYSAARTKYLSELFGVDETSANEVYKKVKHHFDWMAEKFGASSSPLDCIRRLMLAAPIVDKKKRPVDVMYDLHTMAKRHPPIVSQELTAVLWVLSEYVPLAVTSNTNFIPGSILRRVLPVDAFKAFTFSDEAGVSKPSIDIFKITHYSLCEHRVVRMSEILHIGDHHNCDGKGAEQAGMTSTITKDPKNTIEIVHTILKNIG